MKVANVGDYLLWKGKPANIIATIDMPIVVVELLEDKKCPHCGASLGKEQIHVVQSSRMFQEGAEQIKTITDSDMNDAEK